MLRGVIRSLYDHYGLDPGMYNMAGVEKPPTAEEDEAEQPVIHASQDSLQSTESAGTF